jgi:hypothetical protein
MGLAAVHGFEGALHFWRDAGFTEQSKLDIEDQAGCTAGDGRGPGVQANASAYPDGNPRLGGDLLKQDEA